MTYTSYKLLDVFHSIRLFLVNNGLITGENVYYHTYPDTLQDGDPFFVIKLIQDDRVMENPYMLNAKQQFEIEFADIVKDNIITKMDKLSSTLYAKRYIPYTKDGGMSIADELQDGQQMPLQSMQNQDTTMQLKVNAFTIFDMKVLETTEVFVCKALLTVSQNVPFDQQTYNKIGKIIPKIND
ncbi:hypothetical protein [Longirhabdus pacifica]|uniref:hypothetical protein n=1 Tax=Longirhabdus pacifica TaxID=2305227 RepID=UPI0010091569|nr:hypothetical protein [Longirhabdus pacifica]